jgi:hypothetical protein
MVFRYVPGRAVRVLLALAPGRPTGCSKLSVEGASDRPIGLRGRVLVDQRGVHAGVAHSDHEVTRTRPRTCGQRVPGVS